MSSVSWIRELFRCRLGVEQLEDRTTPASAIAVIAGVTGSGSLDAFLSGSGGTVLASDGGNVPGTLSTGALASIAAGNDISVTAQTSIDFTELGGTLSLQTAAGHGVTFTAAGGSISFDNAANSLATAGGTLNLTSSTTISNANLSSGGGGIALTADNLDIQQPIDAGGGIVTLAPFSANQLIDLGGADAAGTLGLTKAELGHISAGVLRVGSATAGAISISDVIAAPAGWSTLSIITAASLKEIGSGAIDVHDLAVQAAYTNAYSDINIDLSTNPSAIVNIAAHCTAGVSEFRLQDSLSLTVTTVDGVVGIIEDGVLNIGSTLELGLASSTPGTVLTVNQPIKVFRTPDANFPNGGAGQLYLVFDTMTFGAAVDSGPFGFTTLGTFSRGRRIDLGATSSADTLGLSVADLSFIRTKVLTVGTWFSNGDGSISLGSGDITIQDHIDGSTNFANLDLESGDHIRETANGTLTVSQLNMQSWNSITMNNANRVGAIGVNVVLPHQALSFTDSIDLKFGVDYFFNNVTVHGGMVILNAPNLSAGVPGGFPGASQVLINQNAFNIKVTSADAGGGPAVTAYNVGGSLRYSFFAYDTAFTGGVRVAVADVNGDGFDDIITAAGAGGGPHVKVFDGLTGMQFASFFAYDPAFAGGVYVAGGDVNGDGLADIITGAGAGGGPHVKVIDSSKLDQSQPNGEIADSALLGSFFAFDAGFTGGVRVAGGDVNSDGHAEIVTGAGPGGLPQVRVFNGADLSLMFDFPAFDPSYGGGVYVAAGDVDGDHKDEIVVSQGQGPAAHVRVLSGANVMLMADFVGLPNNPEADGVRVGIMSWDIDNYPTILVGSGPGGSHVQPYQNSTPFLYGPFDAYDPGFLGGIFVA